ncbi:MAG: RNA polymerase sporulation sigma factor SigH [Veillonella sp.]|jgi:RNA polymerase sporulation-specific sigma factor|uniref:RNA polymerase sporulation sigma factor SigH n=1 Tax=Veillonella sp. TaxID=1926307 RepID=UPI001B426D45|nr:RNA polymerase sporulation sigma factor SigH [Veillonella sp.]NCB95039.1 RNA polymerase sporulation sigma factor SigH [Negativicutes bacterium]MBK7921205.1 RNA polymerase sporulation sigma factor SigH [Veillonella sp.]MBP6922616.1 RNA polymerase sporulation sigma factor SigH [Veillonella sp.]MBP8616273.1 RNA polymerase sporulation sigma factor SigH [Veillonella sp.]MBP9516593.1 RNA polymerase sporulation sigma factor SigH [Veillonella sp.]
MKENHMSKSDYNFNEMSDEEVVVLVQKDRNELAMAHLVNKYKNFVRSKARSYFLVGADRDDIIQEGMIGLYKATRDFDYERQASFRAFAELCVTRQIITAIKTATRQKHMPLNSYISLNKPVYTEESERTLMDMIANVRVSDPEELIITREEFADIEKNMTYLLSELEWHVLLSYLDGKSYQEMAGETDRSIKSIDNALQRVKRKLEKYLEDRLINQTDQVSQEG